MAQVDAVSLAWEVYGSQNCESGDESGELVMAMCGDIFELWVVAGVESRERVSGSLEFYR